MDGKEERIRQRAHNIWLEEGKPDGRASQHWERARREIEELDRGSLETQTEKQKQTSSLKVTRSKSNLRSDIPSAGKKGKAQPNKRTKTDTLKDSPTREN